jgi:hypothetical protein
LQAEVIEHARTKAECQTPHGVEHVVDKPSTFGDGRTDPSVERGGDPFDPTELHPESSENLRHVVMKFTRETLSFLFLRIHQLLRELAHVLLGLFRAPLEKPQPKNNDQRDGQTE